jgi:hypothetical protein
LSTCENAGDPICPSAAERIAGKRLPDRHPNVSGVDAAKAILDLRRSHLEIAGPAMVRNALTQMSDLYVAQMAQRVLTMLRRWEKLGWVASA